MFYGKNHHIFRVHEPLWKSFLLTLVFAFLLEFFSLYVYYGSAMINQTDSFQQNIQMNVHFQQNEHEQRTFKQRIKKHQN